MVMVMVAFSLLAGIREEGLTIHCPPALSFFEVEIISRTPIPLFFLLFFLFLAGQDQSTITQEAETTVAECCLTSRL